MHIVDLIIAITFFFYRYTLNESLIESMYDMCRFDKAWQVNRPSAWCAAFTKDQIKLMEDVNDLRYYFKTGYGLYMNPKLGCLPMRDMLNRFQKIVEGKFRTNGDKYASWPSCFVWKAWEISLLQSVLSHVCCYLQVIDLSLER